METEYFSYSRWCLSNYYLACEKEIKQSKTREEAKKIYLDHFKEWLLNEFDVVMGIYRFNIKQDLSLLNKNQCVLVTRDGLYQLDNNDFYITIYNKSLAIIDRVHLELEQNVLRYNLPDLDTMESIAKVNNYLQEKHERDIVERLTSENKAIFSDAEKRGYFETLIKIYYTTNIQRFSDSSQMKLNTTSLTMAGVGGMREIPWFFKKKLKFAGGKTYSSFGNKLFDLLKVNFPTIAEWFKTSGTRFLGSGNGWIRTPVKIGEGLVFGEIITQITFLVNAVFDASDPATKRYYWGAEARNVEDFLNKKLEKEE